MPKFMLLGLMLLANGAMAQTPPDTPLQRTQALLVAVRDEQQAVYQQFQMIQSLQQAEIQRPDPALAAYATPGQIPNYDDTARARQEQQARLSNYSNELQQLHERYRELGAEASRLVDRMRALSQQGSR
ncbi:MAG: hypothetical protein ABI619_01700 [Betaproteobacteria bacterium]